MDKFEIASRNKFRFESPRGMLVVEDLWDLPLITKNSTIPSLDSTARYLHKKIKEGETESFVVKATKPNEELQLKFDIVKHIIDVRLAENEAADQARVRREKKQRIMAIISAKEDQALENMDIESLRKLVEES